jgi:hypothetical protein
MKRSLVTLGLALSTQLAACMVGDSTATLNHDLTFEEFKELTFLEPWAGGVYIINGDTPVHNEKALYEEWLAHLRRPGADRQHLRRPRHQVERHAEAEPHLLRERQLRRATRPRWSRPAPGHRPRLGDPRQRQLRLRVTAQDANCTASNPNVVFDVNPVNVGGQYLARAFFPNNAAVEPQRPHRQHRVRSQPDLAAQEHHRPRAGPRARLPPRAHPPRVGRVLRGQQLAAAHAVRLGVGHALPAVQRHVEQPGVHAARRRRHRRAVRRARRQPAAAAAAAAARRHADLDRQPRARSVRVVGGPIAVRSAPRSP